MKVVQRWFLPCCHLSPMPIMPIIFRSSLTSSVGIRLVSQMGMKPTTIEIKREERTGVCDYPIGWITHWSIHGGFKWVHPQKPCETSQRWNIAQQAFGLCHVGFLWMSGAEKRFGLGRVVWLFRLPSDCCLAPWDSGRFLSAGSYTRLPVGETSMRSLCTVVDPIIPYLKISEDDRAYDSGASELQAAVNSIPALLGVALGGWGSGRRSWGWTSPRPPKWTTHGIFQRWTYRPCTFERVQRMMLLQRREFPRQLLFRSEAHTQKGKESSGWVSQ